MIRVLLVNDHLGWNGEILHGVGKLFLLTIPRYDRRFFFVVPCVLRDRNQLEDPFSEKGIRIRFLNRGKFHPGTLTDLISLIRTEKIDVLHVQGYAGSTFGRLAGILTRTPVVVQSHSVDPHYPFYMHLPDFLLARATTHCLSLCQTVEAFCRNTRHMPKNRLSRVRLGIDLEEFTSPEPETLKSLRKELRLPEPGEGVVVGTVTRLFEQKGNQYFLEAAARILRYEPTAVFLVVGDGPLRSDLEEQAKALSIADRVRMVGFRSDVKSLIHLFDVAVLSSLWEATPLTAIEALAAGRPLVATDVDGIVEIVSRDETGLLVPPADGEALADAVLSLLRNREKANQLSTKGKERAQELFSVDRYVRDLEAVYRQAVEASR